MYVQRTGDSASGDEPGIVAAGQLTFPNKGRFPMLVQHNGITDVI